MPTITIRLSAAEKDELETAAHNCGQSLSEYVRESLDFVREVRPRWTNTLEEHQLRIEALERAVAQRV
jgi:predicted DNA-binding protein